MNQKPATCHGCPLYGEGKGFVPDTIVSGAKVGLLALSPSKDDAMGRQIVGYMRVGTKMQPIYETTSPKPFIGSGGWFLTQSLLPAAGLTRDQVSMHHVLKCHMPSPPHWDVLHVASHHCVKHHLNIPDEVKVLVTLGEEPWKILQGDLPLNDWRGFTGPKPLEGGVQVYATSYLADLWSDPHLRFVTRLDWKKLPRVV